MPAVLTLLLILFILLLVHRISSAALELTGLARDSSRLQALSALTGVGFTTTESEMIVQHPVRRRVVMLLMLVGNTGIVTVMGTVVIGYIELHEQGNWTDVFLFGLAGILILVIIAHSRRINRLIDRAVVWAMARWTRIEILDYSSLLQVGNGYGVCNLMIESEDWIAQKPLQETRLRAEGILVLGVYHQDGSFEGTPHGATLLRPGDQVVLYGREEYIQRIAERQFGPLGDRDHRKAVAERREVDT